MMGRRWCRILCRCVEGLVGVVEGCWVERSGTEGLLYNTLMRGSVVRGRVGGA